MIGSPFAGDKMLLVDIINARASNCASKRQWNVYRHLVTIEVGVKRSTYEWVKTDCLTFDQNRFKCLKT
jgi:hypothetical protein